MNQIHFAAFFTFYNKIEFDDTIGCYFQYLPEQGRWHEISEFDVREQLTRFMVPFIANNPELYTGRDRDIKDILAHTKAIGRHHDFELPETKLILVKNGTVFVDTSAKEKTKPQLGEWSPIYKLRNQIPLQYDPKNTGCMGFHKFLKGMLPGIDADKKADIELLQYWCGMVLLGRNDLHKIMVITGSAGSGKSTFLNLLEKAIGQNNVATLVTQRLEDRFELSEFFGKTLLIGKDVSPNALNNRASHMLKSLSGDSGIKAEVKHLQRRVTLGGPFHICLMSNSKLNVGVQSDADAWKRRLWVIHSAKPTPAPTIIQNYENVLLKNEGSGILYWMIGGAQKVLKYRRLKRTMDLSTKQAARVTSLINGNDSIEQFVVNRIEASPGSIITSAELHIAYSDYCAKNDMDAETSATFTRRIGRTLHPHHPTASHKNISKATGAFAKGYTNIKLK
jgi:P4 family phage/plasmid primase-like protien